MPAADITFYPAILTDTDWQAKKGKLAKLAGETGVGDLMKKCQAAWKKVDWPNKYAISQRIDWRAVPADKSKPEFVDEVHKKMVGEYTTDVAPVRKLLAELRDKAKEAAASFKKNKLIPSSSVKHATDVAAAADFMYLAMKENSSPVEDMFGAKRMHEDLVKKTQATFQVVKKQISDCEEGLKAALANPTVKGWEDDGAHQGCRSVCNGIAAVPEWKKKFYPTWQAYGDFFCQDIPDNDPQEAVKVKQKVATVAKDLAIYKKFVAETLGH